jgi:hypothetical protein
MLANFIICKRDHEYLDPCAAHTATNNTTRIQEIVGNPHHSIYGAMANG